MKMHLRKAAACMLAWTLLVLSPGVQSYAAAFQVGTSGARGSSAPLLTHSRPVTLPSSTLSIPSAINISAALPAGIPQTGVLSSAMPAAVPATEITAARSAATTSSSVEQLADGAYTLSGSANAPAEQGATVLNTIFQGAAVRPYSDLSVLGAPGEGSANLQPAASSADGQPGPSSQPPAPRESLARAARVGFISAVMPIALYLVTQVVAAIAGYQFHPSYRGPGDGVIDMTPMLAAILFMGAAVMAPISEEMLFRGGLMGGIRALTKKIPLLGSFWIPAAVSSTIFVMVHETADPVLFALRFVHSMILSYAFHREGYAGSIFAHGFFNGLLMLGMIAPFFLPPVAAGIFMTAVMPVSLVVSWFLHRKNSKERADKASGRLVAYDVKTWQAIALALSLIAGFLVMPNIVWVAGAIGWVMYAIRRARRGARSA